MIARGTWYPKHSAEQHDATLVINGSEIEVREGTETLWRGAGSDFTVSDRVGNIPRRLTFADGSVFSTKDNDSIDRWLKASGHQASQANILHLFESRWRWVFLALVLTVVMVFASITWGLPWASEKIAKSLPVSVNETLASGTLNTLDKVLFKPSKTSRARQQEVRKRFKNELLPKDKEGFTYTLHFRHMPGGSDKNGLANAFALPSGELVVTDRLLELAETREELDAILLHEIGHVVHRHSMRQVIQSSALTVALIFITGDASAIEEWTLALPGFLLESNYSRNFESEADAYAFEKMLEQKKDPKSFGVMMSRITEDVGGDMDEGWLKYLSSHPASKERIVQAEEYSAKYKALHGH